MRKSRQGIVAAILASLTLAPSIEARRLPSHESGGAGRADQDVRARIHDGISLDEAVSRAERQYHARVVRTEVQDDGGAKIYVLKLLSDDGRVFTVRIDAATGRMR